MKIRFLLFTLSLLITGISAQSPAAADALFIEKKYEKAGLEYALLLRKKPTNTLYNYRFARCCYEAGNYEAAIKHFLAAGNRYALRDYYLGNSYFNEYRFVEATEYFNNYTNGASDKDPILLKDAYDKLKKAHIAARLINRVEDIEIIDSVIVDKKNFLKHYRLSQETGTFSIQTAENPQKGTIDLVTFITQRGDRKIFSDQTSGRLNLYKANKLLDGWSKAEYLSENINSSYDENYPFLMLDGVTLYFASNNGNTIGGYDIFVSRFNSSTNDYLNPDNIGMPFNSIFNDYMYVIDETMGTGWFATDRYQPENKVTIYQFRYKEEKVFIPVADMDFLTQSAKLKIFRKATLKTNPNQQIVNMPADTQTHEIFFQINDSITYTSTKHFKSVQALILWNDWHKASEELVRQEDLLKSLREVFNTSEDEIDKKDLKEEIIELEKKVLKSRMLQNKNIREIRNEEIKYLKNMH